MRSARTWPRWHRCSRPRPRVARTACARAPNGCTCANASSAATLPAATTRHDGTPPRIGTRPSIRSCARSSRVRTGAGATPTTCSSSRARLDDSSRRLGAVPGVRCCSRPPARVRDQQSDSVGYRPDCSVDHRTWARAGERSGVILAGFALFGWLVDPQQCGRLVRRGRPDHDSATTCNLIDSRSPQVLRCPVGEVRSTSLWFAETGVVVACRRHWREPGRRGRRRQSFVQFNGTLMKGVCQ